MANAINSILEFSYLDFPVTILGMSVFIAYQVHLSHRKRPHKREIFFKKRETLTVPLIFLFVINIVHQLCNLVKDKNEEDGPKVSKIYKRKRIQERKHTKRVLWTESLYTTKIIILKS